MLNINFKNELKKEIIRIKEEKYLYQETFTFLEVANILLNKSLNKNNIIKINIEIKDASTQFIFFKDTIKFFKSYTLYQNFKRFSEIEGKIAQYLHINKVSIIINNVNIIENFDFYNKVRFSKELSTDEIMRIIYSQYNF